MKSLQQISRNGGEEMQIYSTMSELCLLISSSLNGSPEACEFLQGKATLKRPNVPSMKAWNTTNRSLLGKGEAELYIQCMLPIACGCDLSITWTKQDSENVGTDKTWGHCGNLVAQQKQAEMNLFGFLYSTANVLCNVITFVLYYNVPHHWHPQDNDIRAEMCAKRLLDYKHLTYELLVEIILSTIQIPTCTCQQGCTCLMEIHGDNPSILWGICRPGGGGQDEEERGRKDRRWETEKERKCE